ncbi:MAG: hypothetical protein BWY66_00669 [bacterium ADurb.Bin374]|nr:MAG: hypothetical protein BWY66_00669 [bacterium ADurb.Bin374]
MSNPVSRSFCMSWGVIPSDLTTSCVGLYSAAHDLQILRTRRWASTTRIDVVRLNGSMPMFSRRLMVDGASFVWSVEMTRWPVMAALIAMLAVSKSRISPIMMTSGSWRRNERSAAPKSRPMSAWHWTWLMPIRLYSTGSSAVMMLIAGLFSKNSDEYRVVVFPEPVGPVTSTMPFGALTPSMNSSSTCGSKPRSVRLTLRLPWSSRRMQTFSPQTHGTSETRRSTLRSARWSLMRPSCGQRVSAMSRFAMTLMRLTTPAWAAFVGFICSFITPSLRNRTRSSSSNGSMWMSDAPVWTACVMIRFTSLMIGAAFSPSSPSESSPFSAAPDSPTWSARASTLSPYSFPRAAVIESSELTTGEMRMPVIISM